jgi:protein involved in polysaccharide export with SLBB domain
MMYSLYGQFSTRIVVSVLLAMMCVSGSVSIARTETLLRAGDNLKITIFQMIDDERPRDSSAGEQDEQSALALQEVLPRLDLSGEYAVEPDGTVALPVYGRITANGRPLEEFRGDLNAVFTRRLRRPTTVSVSIRQRAPIYVIGVVRNPGSYPFAAGLIVLQALSLAGGELGTQPLLNVEAIRSKARVSAARERVKSALLQTIVRGRDIKPDVFAQSVELLTELVGAEAAKRSLAEEQRIFDLRTLAQTSEREELERAVTAATDELELATRRAKNFDAQLKLRGDRLKMVEGLFTQQVIENDRVQTIRRDIADMEGSRTDAKLRILKAEQALHAARGNRERADAEQTAKRLAQLTTVLAERDDAMRGLASVIAEAEVLAENADATTGQKSILFEILRRTGDSISSLQAGELDALEPGDVLRVRFPSSSPAVLSMKERQRALQAKSN